jgi:hypothetical protein
METRDIILLGGVAIVGYFIVSRMNNPTVAASNAVGVPPPQSSGGGGGGTASTFGSVGAKAGSLVASFYGMGALAPAASSLGRSGATDAYNTTVGTLSGIKQIASGNVVSGAKQVVNESVVKPVTGLFHAIGGLL